MNCAKHPDRPVVDAGVYDKQKCQECIDWLKDGYVDFKRPHWYETMPCTGWLYGTDHEPSYYFGDENGNKRTDARSERAGRQG